MDQDSEAKSKAVDTDGDRFSMHMGITLNRGNYSFTKIDVGIGLYIKWEDRDEAKKRVKEYLESFLRYAVQKIKGEEAVAPSFALFGSLVTGKDAAVITLGRDETVALKDYQSARFGIEWKGKISKDSFDQRRKEIEEWLDQGIQVELDELLS